jgi:hypothetical protein
MFMSCYLNTIVDVYQEWAGPTLILEEIFMKLKRDLVLVDYLTVYSANCHRIDALKLYRGHCEPLLLFFGVRFSLYRFRSMLT